VYEIARWSNTGGASVAAALEEAGVRPLVDAELARYAAMQVQFAIAVANAAAASSSSAAAAGGGAAGSGGGGGGLPGGQRMVLCPNAKCGVQFLTDATSPGRAATPCCKTLVCQACGLDWAASGHAGASCADAATALRADADAALLEGGEEGGSFKRCPSCGTGTSKFRGSGHGCHHITCLNCHSHWCYVCCGPHPCKNGCPGFCEDTCDCPPCPDKVRARARARAWVCAGTGGRGGGAAASLAGRRPAAPPCAL
jgi:hypothetical protein